MMGLLAVGAGPAGAQQPAAASLLPDTAQPASPRRYHPVSRISTTDGQVLSVFIIGLNMDGKGVIYTRRHPLTIPRPQSFLLPSDEMAWLLVGGHYYEPIRRPDQPASGPALRVQAGPRVALFDVPTWKAKVVPHKTANTWGAPSELLPYYFSWTDPLSPDFNHAYYLRRAGEATMTLVPAGPEFATFLADYLADAPALAAAIRAGGAGHHYADVPGLLATYNQLVATPAPTKP